MDITIYLPDALGERAKAENINLSRMLRDELQAELERRDAMTDAMTDSGTHEIELEGYTGRITGVKLVSDDKREVFLTTDERVIVYVFGDVNELRYSVLENPEEELRGEIDGEDYGRVMEALGISAVIDL